MEDRINSRESYSGDLVIYLFQNPRNAKHVYNDLLISKSYSKEDITIMMTAETEEKYFADEDISKTKLGTKALEGMGVGGAIGGTVGALAASITALGTSLLIPGLGILVAGAFAAALMGAGAGAFTGGLVGALLDWEFPMNKQENLNPALKPGGLSLVFTRNLLKIIIC